MNSETWRVIKLIFYESFLQQIEKQALRRKWVILRLNGKKLKAGTYSVT